MNTIEKIFLTLRGHVEVWLQDNVFPDPNDRYNHPFWNSKPMDWFHGQVIRLQNYIWTKQYRNR